MHFDETSKLDDVSTSLDDASAPDAPVRGVPSRTAERQRQQFDERDRAIRDAARRLLLERGLHGFSMDDVAEAIAYSKGTVYQHYDSKEDVLVASCAEAAQEEHQGVQLGRVERQLNLSLDIVGQVVLVLEPHPAGVYQFKVSIFVLDEIRDTIARDTRPIVDNSQSLAREPVEQTALADIGPTDDRDLG